MNLNVLPLFDEYIRAIERFRRNNKPLIEFLFKRLLRGFDDNTKNGEYQESSLNKSDDFSNEKIKFKR